MPLRTELTNLSMMSANRSNLTDSFMSVVDSRMSAAMTNIWIGSPSITESSSSSFRNRCSQSGGACAFSSLAVRARSRARWSVGDGRVGAIEQAGEPGPPRAFGLRLVHAVAEEMVSDHRRPLEPVDEAVEGVVRADAKEVRRHEVDDAVDRRHSLGSELDLVALDHRVAQTEPTPIRRHHPFPIG